MDPHFGQQVNPSWKYQQENVDGSFSSVTSEYASVSTQEEMLQNEKENLFCIGLRRRLEEVETENRRLLNEKNSAYNTRLGGDAKKE